MDVGQSVVMVLDQAGSHGSGLAAACRLKSPSYPATLLARPSMPIASLGPPRRRGCPPHRSPLLIPVDSKGWRYYTYHAKTRSVRGARDHNVNATVRASV